MTVVELAPGGGWYTEILAPYLLENGKLIAAGNDPQSASESARRGAARFQQKLDANAGAFGKVEIGAIAAHHLPHRAERHGRHGAYLP